MRWFNHIISSSGLAKTILQGKVNGKKKQVDRRSGKGIGIDFVSSTWTAEDRTRWKEGVCAKASAVFQRSLQGNG